MAKKILYSVLSIILCAAIAFVACFFAIPDFNAWVKGKITNTETEKDNNKGYNGENENIPSTSGGSEIDEVVDNGIMLFTAVIPRAAYAANGVSEQAENAFTITAEVTPDYASDKSLDWLVSWRNGDSSFASGKTVTDYVTITPTQDGALTAVCTCLKDFGETIVLTVRSRSNPEVFGTCSVQYYQRVKSCDYVFHYNGEEISANNSNGVYKVEYTGAIEDYTVELKPVYSNYTLTDTYTTTINGSLSSTFGYTAIGNMNELKISAGLSGGDPELSENALNWCNYVASQVFDISYNVEYINIGRGLCLGNSQNVHGNYITPKYVLTDLEKQHPRCAYYISLLSDASKFSNSTVFEQTKRDYKNYQQSAYNYFGAEIKTYNDFVTAVKRCNSGNVGVVLYTISIVGEHSSYESVLNLGYNDEFKINVQDLNLSDTEIAF